MLRDCRKPRFPAAAYFYFRFHDRLIAYNHRAFDRGVPLVQLDYPAERIKRVLEKAAGDAKTGSAKLRIRVAATIPG